MSVFSATKHREKKPPEHEPIHQIRTRGQKIFSVINYIILGALALICVLPFWYIVCLSFSSNGAVMSGQVKLLPVDFTLEAYIYVLERDAFWQSMLVTVERIILGLPINMLLIVLSAYPLSKPSVKFHGRGVYVWYFFLTMLINGGMIPTYFVVRSTGLMNSLWSLVIPGLVSPFNLIVMKNFFQGIPQELRESARIDGCHEMTLLFRIILPLSTASLATFGMLYAVGLWNT